MRYTYLLAFFVGFVACQSNTLFDLLNNTDSAPVQWISQWLQSQEGQPVADLLSQADNNFTLFIPSDEVYQAIQSMGSNSTNNTDDTSGGTDNGTTSMVKVLADETSDNTTYFTSPYIQEFNLTDIIYYHMVNQSIDIEAWFNGSSTDSGSTNSTNSTGVNNTDASMGNSTAYNATVLTTLVNNSTIDKLGTGVPLLLQKIMVNETDSSGANSTDGGSTDENSTNNSPTDVSLTSLASLDGGSNFNYTVGDGIGYANINVTNAVQASNGFVYIIDKVLVPPVSLNETIEALINSTNITSPFNSTESFNVTQFDQLLYTLNSTNSSAFESFSNTTNVTYFVPIDEAFSSLTQLDNQTIYDLLASHIVQGVYYTSNITDNSTEIESLAGTNITFAKNDTGFMVNNASVVQPNILVDIGVIHLIDGVLNYTTTSNATDNNSTAVGAVPSNSGVSSDAALSSTVSSTAVSSNAPTSSTSEGSSSPSGNPFPAPSESQSSGVSHVLPSLYVLILALVFLS